MDSLGLQEIQVPQVLLAVKALKVCLDHLEALVLVDLWETPVVLELQECLDLKEAVDPMASLAQLEQPEQQEESGLQVQREIGERMEPLESMGQQELLAQRDFLALREQQVQLEVQALAELLDLQVHQVDQVILDLLVSPGPQVRPELQEQRVLLVELEILEQQVHPEIWDLLEIQVQLVKQVAAVRRATLEALDQLGQLEHQASADFPDQQVRQASPEVLV